MRRTDKVPAPSTERFYPACHLSELSCGKAKQTGLKSWAGVSDVRVERRISDEEM